MGNREWGRNQGHRKGRLEHQPLGSWSKALLCGLSYKIGENTFSPLTAESVGVFWWHVPGTELGAGNVAMKDQLKVPKTRQTRKSVVSVQGGKDCGSGRLLWSREEGCQPMVPLQLQWPVWVFFAHLLSSALPPKASYSSCSSCVTLKLQSAPHPEGILVWVMVIIFQITDSRCSNKNSYTGIYSSIIPTNQKVETTPMSTGHWMQNKRWSISPAVQK